MCVCVCVCVGVYLSVCVSVSLSVYTITQKVMVHLKLEHTVVYGKSSTLGIVRSSSRSRCNFEIFLHLPQYKCEFLYLSFGTG